jgi:hypothetical protein
MPGLRRKTVQPRIAQPDRRTEAQGDQISKAKEIIMRNLAAVQNAASISSLLLTTNAIISEIKEDKPEPAVTPGGGMGGMY